MVDVAVYAVGLVVVWLVVRYGRPQLRPVAAVPRDEYDGVPIPDDAPWYVEPDPDCRTAACPFCGDGEW